MPNQMRMRTRFMLRLRYAALYLLRGFISAVILAGVLAGAIGIFSTGSEIAAKVVGLLVFLIIAAVPMLLAWNIGPSSFCDMRKNVASTTKRKYMIEDLAMFDENLGVRHEAVKHLKSPALLIQIAQTTKSDYLFHACVQCMLTNQKRNGQDYVQTLREFMTLRPKDAAMRLCPYCFNDWISLQQKTETTTDYEYCSTDTVVGSPSVHVIEEWYECSNCGHREDYNFSQKLSDIIGVEAN